MDNSCNGSFFSGVALKTYFKTGHGNEPNNSPSSLAYEVLSALSKYLSFSYQMDYLPKANQSIPRVGLYPELLSKVNRKEADFAIAHICASSERMMLVGFSFPFYITAVGFVLRSRLKDKSGLLTNIFFLDPLSLRVWTIYITLVIVIATVLKMFSEFYKRIKGHTGDSELSKYCFRVILRQDVPRLFIRGIGVRLLISLWMLGSMLLGNFFCGGLTSSTSLLQKQEIVKTIDDLVRAVLNKEFDAFSIKGNAFDKSIKESTSGPLQVFRNNIERKNLVVPSSLEEAFHRIMTEKSALLLTSISTKLFTQKNDFLRRSVYISKESFYAQYYSVALQKCFPCVEEFNKGIIRLIETGLTQKWESTMTRIYTYQMDERSKSTEANYIIMNDQKALFLLLTIGLLSALCTLMMEQCLHKLHI